MLIMYAAHNGILEEILIIGYLLRGWTSSAGAVEGDRVQRGAAWLLPPVPGIWRFIGNAAMGLIFGYLYRRWGRVPR